MSPLVSIGLPTYNRAASLDRAIASALSQTHAELELVVSDNASTDATEAVCRRWASSDARVRYVRQTSNVGMVANFNAVIGELRGEYALLLADDDWLDADYVEACLAELLAHPDHALVAGRSRLHDGGVAIGFGQLVDLPQEDAGVRVRHFLRTVQDNSIFYGLTRTRALQDAAPMHRVLGGDWLLVAGIAFTGKVRTIAATHVNRAKGGTSTSVRNVLAVLGITRPLDVAFPWLVLCAVAFADMAWRSRAYASLTAGARLAFALRTAPSAIHWKGQAWQAIGPPMLALRRRPRGRPIWRAFAGLVDRAGGVPWHEVED
jgi:hypothetical protein